jgi:HD-like signal output (HDOD) protein
LRSLATALLTRQLAADSPTTRTLSNQLWEHTTQVASLASALARHVTHINPETAMFAAIVHEIGGFYLLSRAEKMPEIMDGEFAEWIETGETEVGRAMLKNLGIPNSIVEAMEDVWAGYLSMPPVTLADTLLLADELASTPSPLHQPGYRGASDARAAELEMLINQETLSHILAEAAEEVNSLNQALRF